MPPNLPTEGEAMSETPALKPCPWQTIESAPKDGTPIAIARHMGEFGWVMGTATWQDVAGIAGWLSHGWGFFGDLGLGNPTHWMPLPSAPSCSAPKPDASGSIAPSLSDMREALEMIGRMKVFPDDQINRTTLVAAMNIARAALTNGATEDAAKG